MKDEHDQNDGWITVRSRRWKEASKRGTTEKLPELNASHDLNYEKTTITVDSGAAVSAMPEDMLSNARGHAVECATEPKVREQVLPSSKRIQKQRSRWEECYVEDDARVHTVDDIQSCGRDQSFDVPKQDMPEEGQSSVRRERKLHRERGIGKGCR